MQNKRIKAVTVFPKIENTFAFLSLIFIVIIPFLSIAARLILKTGIPGSSEYIYNLVLWVTFSGAVLTSREQSHLALAAGIDVIKEPYKHLIKNGNALISSSFTFAFAWSSLSLLFIGFDVSDRIGIFPARFVILIMPAGCFIMALRFIFNRDLTKKGMLIAGAGVVLGLLLSLPPIVNILYFLTPEVPILFDNLVELWYQIFDIISPWLIIIVIIAAGFGLPLFIVLGGIAYLLFANTGGVLEIIPSEAYTMLTGVSIPAIPLFTLAGFILSESNAGQRLVKLFQSLLGWLPGGYAVMAVIVCTFFTTFTGASGVTILALGGLLSFILIKNGTKENFTIGLLTSSGSIGLLFPPALPIILYGVVAQISIKNMYIGGIFPGLIMVSALSAMGIIDAFRNKHSSISFNASEAVKAVYESKWELLLPVIVILGYFLGFTTIIETGSIAVIYAFFVEVIIHKDIKIREIPNVLGKSIPVIGGVLIILAVSRGLSYYIVDAEMPMLLTAWVRANIHSKLFFLILLNLTLLVTGCFMDIFSAIMVVVPLILPLGALFNIHPVHLGIIFLSNLGLGFLTPPIGLNLFLASYRFKKPLVKIYKDVIPFFLVLLAALLLITYIPALSTCLLPDGN